MTRGLGSCTRRWSCMVNHFNVYFTYNIKFKLSLRDPHSKFHFSTCSSLFSTLFVISNIVTTNPFSIHPLHVGPQVQVNELFFHVCMLEDNIPPTCRNFRNYSISPTIIIKCIHLLQEAEFSTLQTWRKCSNMKVIYSYIQNPNFTTIYILSSSTAPHMSLTQFLDK